MYRFFKKSILFLLGIIVFNGCMYNPHQKNILFENGKPYALPYGVSYSYNSRNNILLLRKAGIDCRPGDLDWVEHSVRDKLLKNNNKKQTPQEKEKNLMAIIRKAYRESKIGCAHPLTQQEYNYYLNKENQQAASDRAWELSNAISAPKTYNVNVYHY